MDIEKGEVSLNQFLKLNPEYIRITPSENSLKGVVHKTKKIEGQNISVNIWFETKIKMNLVYSDTRNVQVDYIHLHYGDTENLKTLLSLKPETLNIKYWLKNSSELIRKAGLNYESIYITGLKNHGKRQHEINYHTVYRSDIQKKATTHFISESAYTY